jgi:DNA-binding MarR family transcriptional regulator
LIVLHHLALNSGLSINELADLTVTDRSSVADAVDRLSRREFVERTWSVQDRRRAVVTITQKGWQALERAPATPTVQLARALERLPDFELQMLARALERLTIELGIEQWKPWSATGDRAIWTPRRDQHEP